MNGSTKSALVSWSKKSCWDTHKLTEKLTNSLPKQDNISRDSTAKVRKEAEHKLIGHHSLHDASKHIGVTINEIDYVLIDA